MIYIILQPILFSSHPIFITSLSYFERKENFLFHSFMRNAYHAWLYCAP
jgi:hypothetical protein